MEKLNELMDMEGIKKNIVSCEEQIKEIGMEKESILKREKEASTYLFNALRLSNFLSKAKENPLFRLGVDSEKTHAILNEDRHPFKKDTIRNSVLKCLEHDRSFNRGILLKEVRRIRHSAKKNSVNAILGVLIKEKVVTLKNKMFSAA